MNIPSNFKKVNDIPDSGQSLWFNELDNSLYVLKSLKYYDLKVFNYLKSKSDSHIPHVVYFEEENDILYVMEDFVDGMTLEDYLSVNPDLSFKEKIKILNELCDGLNFLHKAPQPIIHRDLKPTNIMVDKAGLIKIIDYDAARTFKLGESHDTLFVGTVGIAAPEQYGFAQSDPRTDIYALGRITSFMFPSEINSKHHWIKSVVQTATSMDPKDRYQNIKDFKEALNNHGNTHRLIPLPGFRTKNPYKMFFGGIGYPMLILFNIAEYNSIMKFPNTRELNIAYCIEITMVMFVLFDFFTDWTGLFSHLPFMKSKNWAVKVPFMTIYLVAIVIIFRTISGLLRTLLG